MSVFLQQRSSLDAFQLVPIKKQVRLVKKKFNTILDNHLDRFVAMRITLKSSLKLGRIMKAKENIIVRDCLALLVISTIGFKCIFADAAEISNKLQDTKEIQRDTNGLQLQANRDATHTSGQEEPDQQTLDSMMMSHKSGMMGHMGDMMQQGMAHKQQLLQRGMQAKQQMVGALQGSMQGVKMRSHGHMESMAGMMESAQKTMMKGGQEMKQQLKQSLEGHMGRMQGIHGIGENMMGSVQRVGRTLSEGVSSTVNQLTQTGQKVAQQLRGDMKKNSNMMSNIVGSMHGSMDNMGKGMQKNLMGLMGSMQGAVGQISSQLSKVAQAPMQILEKVSQLKSNMMNMGGGGAGRHPISSGGNRY